MSRDINLLHPRLQTVLYLFLNECKSRGLSVGVADTLRSKAEQDGLYALGRTKKGSIVTNCRYPNSPHNWGLAFDIYRNDGRGAYNDEDGWFYKCGQVGKGLGLFWGGDFKSFKDRPHFELASFLPDNSCRELISKYGTPERFFDTWEDEMTQEQFDKMMEDYLRRRGEMGMSVWAEGDMARAVELGITDGKRPQAFATREEVAAMVGRGVT